MRPGPPEAAGAVGSCCASLHPHGSPLVDVRRHLSLVTIYLLGVATAGAVALVISAIALANHVREISLLVPFNSPWSPVTIALFLVLVAVASWFTVLVPEEQGQNSSHNLSTVGFLAAVVVFPIYLAVLIVGVVALVGQVTFLQGSQQRARRFSAFNFGNWVLATAGAAIVFNGLGGRVLLLTPHLPQDGPLLVLVVAGAISMSYVISYGLTVVAVSLVGRALAGQKLSDGHVQPRTFTDYIRETFARSHRNAILPEATAAIVGILFGYLWLATPPLAPIALLPLAVIYIAFKNFIRLQELDRLKSNFITEVSHELRTPLSAIVASSNLLYHHADELETANVRDIFRGAYESSNHLFRLVENLLNATTLQSGTLHIRPVAISLDELIGDAVIQTHPFLESKRQTLGIELPPDLPDVLADPQQIVQVLINLLTNASKYSEPATHIEISCTAEGNEVRVTVVDDGVGIPARGTRTYLRKVLSRSIANHDLRRGFRPRTEYRKVFGGTAQGSRRSCESARRRQPILVHASANKNGRGDMSKIMIVDDDQNLLELLAFALSKTADHEVTKVPLATEALAVWRSTSPDLVVLDVNMPDGSGFELCRAAQRRVWLRRSSC